MAACDGGDDRIVRLCRPQSVVLLCILPFSNICGFLWCYTALPLHWVDSGWPLWQLALLLTLIYIPRVLATAIKSRVGEWLCVPISAVAAALNIYMLVRPESKTSVWVALTATCASQCPTTYRSFVYSRFYGSGSWQVANPNPTSNPNLDPDPDPNPTPDPNPDPNPNPDSTPRPRGQWVSE